MYEYLDTKHGIKGSALAFKNLSFRIMVRGGYLAINTFVSAVLPFLGDFMSLTGAISTFPLTFILANHMYLVAQKNKLTSIQKLWHWINICFFAIMSAAATVAALRLIALDSKTYHPFADIWLDALYCFTDSGHSVGGLCFKYAFVQNNYLPSCLNDICKGFFCHVRKKILAFSKSNSMSKKYFFLASTQHDNPLFLCCHHYILCTICLLVLTYNKVC